MHTMDLKTTKKITVNKVTKDIKGNQKNYSVTEKSGIKRDMERQNMGQTEDKEQDDRIKHNWRRQWYSTPVLLPGKSHGQRNLVGCSPWGREESDITEKLPFHFSFSCIGEGNDNPLQCSCLENPRDRGACWAAIYGVTQSRTRLK